VITVRGGHFQCTTYKRTLIKVEAGDLITIRADGQLTMTPWGSSVRSTPEGTSQCGWANKSKRIYVGTLVARIGSGDMIKIGSKAEFRAKRSGMLQLAVAMQSQYAGYAYPGEYKVKVTVK
jgi:hypothetical protein